MSIPVVDLQQFLSNDHFQKKQFIHTLGKAYEDVGFVAVSNHGIPADLITALYKQVQTFFALPTEVKRKYERVDLAGQRGYTSFGKEHAKGSVLPDLKEFFHVGVDLPEGHPLEKIYPAKVRVPQIAEFDATLGALYKGLLDLGCDLLKALSLWLNLDEEFFEDFVIFS